MASMNNWLGFSLSPQQTHSQNSVSHLDFNSDQISASDVSADCFDLTSHSTLPSLNLPPPFGILEAFNTNTNNTHHDSQELSMLMGGSSCNLESHGPKLENFLGISAYESNGEYMYPNCSMQVPSVAATDAGGGGGGNNGSTIGLSMIKNWLRNNPTPHQAENNKDGGCDVAVMGTTNVTNAQTLSLSMSTGSQSSSPLPLASGSSGGGGGLETSSSDNKRQMDGSSQSGGAIEAVPRKSIDTFGQRTSIYRGVTRHRWTGRYEAHLWDNSCRREGQTRKGRQVYLGGYDKEEKAARAYDLAALKYWGTTTTTNFPIANYEKEVEEMKHMTRQEYVASLRRKSSGFSRGASIYRGVTRHHQHGRWQARIGRVAGNKDLYLGTFSTQEEAAEAYDIAAIKFRGLNAVTNFEINRYDVKSILESHTLPIGGASKQRLKDAEMSLVDTRRATTTTTTTDNHNLTLTDGIINHYNNWPTTIAFQQAQPLMSIHYPYVGGGDHQRLWCKQEQHDDGTTTQSLHHLQLGNTNTPHNFFNLMNLDSSSSMEHSSAGSNSVIYNSNGGVGDGNIANYGVGYDCSGGGYVMPMGTSLNGQGNNQTGNFEEINEVKPLGSYESHLNYGSSLYYLSQQQQQQQSGAVRASVVYDEGSACNNWVPTAIPTLGPRSTGMGGLPWSSNFDT